jgi:hypothetical protein
VVLPDYAHPHLIYTNMGDLKNDPNLCFSHVGRVGAQGGRRGQIINLGSPGCLAFGIILHETLHALGKQAQGLGFCVTIVYNLQELHMNTIDLIETYL